MSRSSKSVHAKGTSQSSLAAALVGLSYLSLVSSSQIASLWSNYGHIYRLTVSSAEPPPSNSSADIPKTLILKSIHPPHTDRPSESHLRKLLSYDVERWFYHNLSGRLPPSVKLAHSYPNPRPGELLLEDLSVNYPHPARGSLGLKATQCVLSWLAGFHATFWGVAEGEDKLQLVPPPTHVPDNTNPAEAGQGVWEQGTYWYLDTRREELADVDDEEYAWLMPWVEKVDAALKKEHVTHSTLLHGDVKGANIVFSQPPFRRPSTGPFTTPLQCALYDLQYVGRGVPTHDLIYFLGTSVDSSLLSGKGEFTLLDFYYDSLVAFLGRDRYDKQLFLRHWELSIVDWYRFMAGWGFWGNDRWVERRAKAIVEEWSSGGWTYDP